ncbi:uncharacterized protein SPAPADRAFT_134248 [Spathaspora passalidarum NRRL Y-27907]|uniref:Zn(2)-C6 fungal-type domain-containing protein n=1 Tax=Spathaspora passalidarum (strain NRRL Y-27907 / 11-Y1) TaxID=619300 RepID=G3AJZ5_SPAPN|nr:uncharacterized protein SPAPADRAFT_134248 [Spathaspora passalidarum NRRL Y-27907]EGW34046.1 hypothetical protein SPAPADRAFT_134248 [Spathaspora passalidarum NRRL Y-27907]
MNNSNGTKKRKHTPSETRKLAQASRILKACDNCRKQKTRCFRSPENPNSCVRCHALNKSCSFETFNFDPYFTDNNKLDLIYNGINEVLGLLKNTPTMVATPISNSSSINSQQQENEKEDSNEFVDDSTQFQSPPSSFITSPFLIISNSVPESVPSPIHKLLNPSKYHSEPNDVISLSILSESDAITLMDEFRRDFGKWISLPIYISTKDWIDEIRIKSSLLLTTGCCITIGKTTSSLPVELSNKLIQDMNECILKYSFYHRKDGIIEFLQAMVLLSTYSISISSLVLDSEANLDSWTLSQIGLSTFISSSTFGHLKATNDDITLTQLRIYNHLCLTHLFYCMISGRMCIIDEIRINQCYGTLSLLNATNFDGRMVAEINMILITYTFIQLNNNVQDLSELDHNLMNVLEETKLWYQQWEYLFSQPTIQFVELNYHFCTILIYYGYEYHKSKITGRKVEFLSNASLNVLNYANEFSLIEMFNHAYSLVKEINNLEDDIGFSYLSDQIHFCFYFAALCLIKILYQCTTGKGYSEQLSEKENVMEVVNTLVDKFSTISRGDSNNAAFKYKSGIEQILQSHFPEYSDSS